MDDNEKVKEIADLKKKLEDSENANKDKDNEIQKLADDLDALKKAHDDEIADLKKKLDDLQNANKDKDNEIKKLADNLDALKKANEEDNKKKDDEIADLKKKLDDLQNANKDKDNEIKKLADDMEQLKNKKPEEPKKEFKGLEMLAKIEHSILRNKPELSLAPPNNFSYYYPPLVKSNLSSLLNPEPVKPAEPEKPVEPEPAKKKGLPLKPKIKVTKIHEKKEVDLGIEESKPADVRVGQAPAVKSKPKEEVQPKPEEQPKEIKPKQEDMARIIILKTIAKKLALKILRREFRLWQNSTSELRNKRNMSMNNINQRIKMKLSPNMKTQKAFQIWRNEAISELRNKMKASLSMKIIKQIKTRGSFEVIKKRFEKWRTISSGLQSNLVYTLGALKLDKAIKKIFRINCFKRIVELDEKLKLTQTQSDFISNITNKIMKNDKIVLKKKFFKWAGKRKINIISHLNTLLNVNYFI